MELVIASLLVLAFLAVALRSRFDRNWGQMHFVPPFVSRAHPTVTPHAASDLAVLAAQSPRVAPDGLKIKQLVWAGTLEADFARPFPTLAAIDSARLDGTNEFARDPFATELEALAMRLITRHWSDLVWLTGQIDQTRFDALCADLERERLALLARVPSSMAPLAEVSSTVAERIPA